MRPVWALSVFFVLLSCGSSVPPPPRNLDDACLIRKERPQWFDAMLNAQKRWGVPVEVQMAVIYQESKFRGDARTPLSFKLGVIPMGRYSSAFGYAQAIDSTWKWYRRDTGRQNASRTNFADSVDFLGWYMEQSHQKLGISVKNARKQYLAYHDGHAGYRRGSHRHKRWLLRISRKVQKHARTYGKQLAGCTS